MVRYIGFRENKKQWGQIDSYGVYRNMVKCILEVNPEGLRWLSTLCLFTILLILPQGLRYSLQKRGQHDKGALILKQRFKAAVTDFYWWLRKISCRFCLLFCYVFGDIKRNPFKSSVDLHLHSFILTEFFDLLSCCSKWRERYKPRPLLICLKAGSFGSCSAWGTNAFSREKPEETAGKKKL